MLWSDRQLQHFQFPTRIDIRRCYDDRRTIVDDQRLSRLKPRWLSQSSTGEQSLGPFLNRAVK